MWNKMLTFTLCILIFKDVVVFFHFLFDMNTNGQQIIKIDNNKYLTEAFYHCINIIC